MTPLSSPGQLSATALTHSRPEGAELGQCPPQGPRGCLAPALPRGSLWSWSGVGGSTPVGCLVSWELREKSWVRQAGWRQGGQTGCGAGGKVSPIQTRLQFIWSCL